MFSTSLDRRYFQEAEAFLRAGSDEARCEAADVVASYLSNLPAPGSEDDQRTQSALTLLEIEALLPALGAHDPRFAYALRRHNRLVARGEPSSVWSLAAASSRLPVETRALLRAGPPVHAHVVHSGKRTIAHELRTTRHLDDMKNERYVSAHSSFFEVATPVLEQYRLDTMLCVVPAHEHNCMFVPLVLIFFLNRHGSDADYLAQQPWVFGQVERFFSVDFAEQRVNLVGARLYHRATLDEETGLPELDLAEPIKPNAICVLLEQHIGRLVVLPKHHIVEDTAAQIAAAEKTLDRERRVLDKLVRASSVSTQQIVVRRAQAELSRARKAHARRGTQRFVLGSSWHAEE